MFSGIKNWRLPMPEKCKKLAENDLHCIAAKIYNNYLIDFVKKSNIAVSTALPSPPAEILCHDDFLMRRTNQTTPPAITSNDIWIFGYGSLVWKADFPYIDRRRGYICGYKRRFYQHSIDHRGVPEKPGRVVTLLPGNLHEDRVYGVAYRIAGVQKAQVLDHLDYREKNGYERCKLGFHEFPTQNVDQEGAVIYPTCFEVIMYIATQDNDSYAGDAWQVEAIAKQIFSSAGPSGPNREYLFNLDMAMHALFPGVNDEHLTELVQAVEYLIKHKEAQILEKILQQDIENALIVSYTELDKKDNDSNVNLDDMLKSEIIKNLDILHKNLQCVGWRERSIARYYKQEQETPKQEAHS